jgi:hypothetical protein
VSNEVAHDFNGLYLDFIEERGLQLWPEWNIPVRGKQTIKCWTIQCRKPFIQVSHENLKGAITKIAFRLGDLRFKEPNA